MIKQYKSEGSKVRETVGEDSVGHRGPERLGTHLPLGSRYLERIVCSRLVKEAMTWNLFYLHTFCLRLGLRFQTVKPGNLKVWNFKRRRAFIPVALHHWREARYAERE